MSIPKQLLERFFLGVCTEEEKQQVLAFFQRNPEKLAQYLTDDSWENFIPDSTEVTPTEKLRSRIEGHIGRMPATVKKIRYVPWMAAASVILLAGLGIFLLQHKDTQVQKPAVAATNTPAGPTARVPKELYNKAGRTKTFLLPDGSAVDLAAASSLSFNDPFIEDRRDIYLKGAAVFHVKKDNARPFIVHAKGISTTVLGTVFSVSDKQALFTTIHLFSGKVVVKKDNDRSFKDIYMSPGQQLVINKENFSVQIKTPAPVVTATPKDSTLSSPLQIQSFDNRPLGEIFSLLQESYHITIDFDPAIVANMSFTGKFNRQKESLESFIHTLCDLDELSLKTTGDNSFIIQGK